MKILIADDEKLVRFSLKSMLEEIGIPGACIHAAADGEEMIAAARKLQPDIAFVDIRMPKLNGLEAIERVRAQMPFTRWVILTSFPSFDYAKKAIGLGAAEYLLKPVSPRELAEVISRLSQQRQADWLRANEEFEAQVNALFHDTLSLQRDSQGFFAAASFLPVQLVFDGTLQEGRLQAGRLEACDIIRSKLAAVVGSGTRLALSTMPEGALLVLGSWKAGEEAHVGAETMRAFLRTATGLVMQALSPRITVTSLHGEECASFTLLREQLRELGRLAALRSVLGVGRSWNLAELRRRGSDASLTRLAAALEGLAGAFRGRKLLEFLRQQEALLAVARAQASHRDINMKRAAMSFLRCSLGFVAPAAATLENSLAALADWGRRTLASRTDEEAQDPVARTIDFIGSHYAQDIGLGQIARQLSLTPNYLSSLFHHTTGMTFVRYLTRLRLDQASALLARPGARVQEVARQVGYAGVRHFSRLFHQQFGCLPSQYLRKRTSRGGEV